MQVGLSHSFVVCIVVLNLKFCNSRSFYLGNNLRTVFVLYGPLKRTFRKRSKKIGGTVWHFVNSNFRYSDKGCARFLLRGWYLSTKEYPAALGIVSRDDSF